MNEKINLHQLNLYFMVLIKFDHLIVHGLELKVFFLRFCCVSMS